MQNTLAVYGPHCTFNGEIPEPWEDNPVTVGIGVLCEYGNCAVLASDMRVTYGKMKVDTHEIAGKQYSFPPFNLAGAIAGSTSSTHAIFSELSSQLKILLAAYVEAKKTHPSVRIYFEHIRNAIEISRKRELRRLQKCAMESQLGVSVEDWIAGTLPTGQPFNEYAHREGLRVLRRVKEEMDYQSSVILVGFIKDEAVFCRGIGAHPVEEAVSPAIFVIGGKGAVDALQVLVNRKQNIEMGIARTLLHIYEALKVARKDKGVGDASSYVVIRPHTSARPNGMLRFHPDHPMIKQWSKDYALRNTEPLETSTANDLVNKGLIVNKAPRSQWLGARELMLEM